MGLADDAPLGYLLYRVGAVLRPEVSAALSPLGLTLPEFVCLRMLSQSPGLSSAELARHASVTPQAMNTVLRKLEDAGAVARPGIGVFRAFATGYIDRSRPSPGEARRGRRTRRRCPRPGQADRASATRVQTNAGEARVRLDPDAGYSAIFGAWIRAQGRASSSS